MTKTSMQDLGYPRKNNYLEYQVEYARQEKVRLVKARVAYWKELSLEAEYITRQIIKEVPELKQYKLSIFDNILRSLK